MQIQCPYCNSLIDAAVLAAAGSRVRCPRCGDSFPNRWLDQTTAETSAAPLPEPAKRSNRQAALAVFGIMLAMATVGLLYALWTAPARQNRHPDPIKIFAAQQYRPAELSALGYLPFDSKLVAAIHIADLRKDKFGKELLEDPHWPPLKLVLERIKLWTDLPLEAIDHVALGVHVPAGETPGVVLAVQTRRPYAATDLQRLHADKPAEMFYERPLFRFNIQPIGAGVLWCADERTLVFMLRLDSVERAHLDRVPLKALNGAEGLPDDIQRLMKEQLPAQPAAWVVGQVHSLVAGADWLKLTPLPGELLDPLMKIKTVTAGLQLRNDISLLVMIEGIDLNAAYSLQDAIERTQSKAVKVIGLPTPAVLAASSIGLGSTGIDALTLAPVLDQRRLLVQIRGDAETIRAALK